MGDQQRRNPKGRDPIGGTHERRRLVDGRKRERQREIRGSLMLKTHTSRRADFALTTNAAIAHSASSAANKSPKAAGSVNCAEIPGYTPPGARNMRPRWRS